MDRNIGETDILPGFDLLYFNKRQIKVVQKRHNSNHCWDYQKESRILTSGLQPRYDLYERYERNMSNHSTWSKSLMVTIRKR